MTPLQQATPGLLPSARRLYNAHQLANGGAQGRIYCHQPMIGCAAYSRWQ